MENKDLLRLVQRRVANISIGPSTLRNQGFSSIVSTTIEFLKNDFDLRKLKYISRKKFFQLLDQKTEELRKIYIEKCKENEKCRRQNIPNVTYWGTARKAINVFLEHAFYNRFLFEKYNLKRLEEILELPLDRQVAMNLYDRAKKEGENLPEWVPIKSLEKDKHDKYQEYAKKHAIKEGVPGRIYLDLHFWRSENKQSNKKI